MADQLDRIEAQLTGRVENSLRHFIQDQDRRTRELFLEDGKKTRAEVLKQAENTRTAISWQLAAQMERIEERLRSSEVIRADRIAEGRIGAQTA